MSYDEALALVAERSRQLSLRQRSIEQVNLGSVAGRVLAKPFYADRDQPPFARSTRDGYACRAAEMQNHASLPVVGSIRAGEVSTGPLALGAVFEIMTGAQVPEGADAVVMLEHVEAVGSLVRLVLPHTIERGENIVCQGAEARKGEELTPAGTRLSHAHIAVAAACGYAAVTVYAKPLVAILATGDELVSVDASPGPGQIRNSNAPMLAAMTAAAGGKPLVLPKAADDPEALDTALGQAANADLLLISGGVSAGKYDLVEEALARSGAEFHFTGVRIQPGKPLVFGHLPRRSGADERIQPFFGLPGNPISSAATFLLFAVPVLSALAGATESASRFVLARLVKDCRGKPGLTGFVPARCAFNAPPGELPSVAAVAWQGSGDLSAFARSNCFLVVPEGADCLRAGEIARILLF